MCRHVVRLRAMAAHRRACSAHKRSPQWTVRWPPLRRDGHGGTGIRVHYADFWGDSYLQQVEAKTGGRGGPYENMGQYAAVTSPVSDADGKPADPQLCVIVRSKHEELYDCMAKYGIVEDTGARLTLGYHKDSRIVRIPYKYEDYGCPAPTRAQLDAYWKTQGVEVHRI